MLNPFLPLIQLTPFQFIALAAPMVLGLLCLVATIVLLFVQLIKKKKLKATKVVLIIAVLLIAAGIAAFILSGAIKFNPTSDSSEMSSSTVATGSTVKVNDIITFSTKDKDGNAIDSSVFKDSKVTLINRWEPWCEPCKNEMPDLQALYEKYGADGFNILGVYSEEKGLQEALEKSGVNYPIILATEELNRFGSSYPGSVFVDSEGHVLELPKEFQTIFNTNKCVIMGAQSADNWELLIKGYLGQ